MTTPEPSRPESPIADTQMFRRFVDDAPAQSPRAAAAASASTSRSPWLWVWIGLAVVVIGVLIGLLLH